MLTYTTQLKNAWKHNRSLLCVGLDPDSARMPAVFQRNTDGIFAFCREIIDATAPYVCAFKPQIAYFSAIRAEAQLEKIGDYIRTHYPHVPIILDAKRGDIGATAQAYAKEAFERYGAHAVTVNPYMGGDSIEPYLAWENKGCIILCRTSNVGGADIQLLSVNGRPLYQHVAQLVSEKWNKHGQCSLVVGATYPEDIKAVRDIVGDMPLLVPGIGTQGGDVEKTVLAGKTKEGGMVINVSRAILYATPLLGEDSIAAARRVAQWTRDEINLYLD